MIGFLFCYSHLGTKMLLKRMPKKLVTLAYAFLCTISWVGR